MEQDSFDSGRKLSVIGDLLFVDDQGLSLEEQGPEDRAVPLLDVASQEDLNSASYDYNNNSLSFVAHQSFDKKKFGSARSGGLAEFCPPVCQIKTEPEEMAQEELMFYGWSYVHVGVVYQLVHSLNIICLLRINTSLTFIIIIICCATLTNHS